MPKTSPSDHMFESQYFFMREPVREPVKYYIADFSAKGGRGVPPHSAKENSAIKQVF